MLWCIMNIGQMKDIGLTNNCSLCDLFGKNDDHYDESATNKFIEDNMNHLKVFSYIMGGRNICMNALESIIFITIIASGKTPMMKQRKSLN